MPRKRKCSKRRRSAGVLSDYQRAYLLTGQAFEFLRGEDDEVAPFASLAAGRRAWKAHRASLIEETGDTCKPWAQWAFDEGGETLKGKAVPRGRAVFPDAIQRGDWKLDDDWAWDVKAHQWHSEHGRVATEHPWYGAARKKAKKDGWNPVWLRTWADVEAVKSGCRFDIAAAEYACGFFRLLRHTKAPFAGQPFVLLPWQRYDVIMPLFGWMRPDGAGWCRRFRTAYVEIPKKNGKSTLCAGISLLLEVADGEAGAEVYNVAAAVDQAKIVFKEALRMAKGCPYITRLLEYRESVKHIAYPAGNSEYVVLSSDSATAEGKNISGLIFDELHAQKDRELYDALIYGGAARRQPLFVAITTAGVYDPLSIGWEQHEYARRNLEGGAGPGEDVTFFGYIRGVFEDDEKPDQWTEPSWWYRANPGLGVTIDYGTFEQEAKTAAEVVSKQNSFKRYRLSIWVHAAEAAFDVREWAACLWEPGEVAA